jgi:hypothetical protein
MDIFLESSERNFQSHQLEMLTGNFNKTNLNLDPGISIKTFL